MTNEHAPYTLLQDHRHYTKGQVVLLRKHVAEALAAQGIVADEPDSAEKPTPKTKGKK
jgi:hypothetical protein